MRLLKHAPSKMGGGPGSNLSFSGYRLDYFKKKTTKLKLDGIIDFSHDRGMRIVKTNDMGARELGESLARLRLTQADLARIIGKTEQCICGWATGKRKVDGAAAAYLRYRVRVARMIDNLEANDASEA